MAQIYGKPPQNVEGNHALAITVVSRTMRALNEADADLEADVIEYSELKASSPTTERPLNRPGFRRGSFTWLPSIGCCLS